MHERRLPYHNKPKKPSSHPSCGADTYHRSAVLPRSEDVPSEPTTTQPLETDVEAASPDQVNKNLLDQLVDSGEGDSSTTEVTETPKEGETGHA